MKRIFFDMDGTLAEWRTNARPEDLFKKGYFRTLRPMKEMVDAAERLSQMKDEYQIFVLSAYWQNAVHALPEKKAWCDEHLPFIPEANRLFVPDGITKPGYVTQNTGEPVCASDILVDDYSKNLIEWQAAGGTAIKCLNGTNDRSGRFTGIRASTSAGVISAVRSVNGKQ